MDNVTGGLETSHRRYTEKLTEVESGLKKLGNLHAIKAPLYSVFEMFSWKIVARNLSEKNSGYDKIQHFYSNFSSTWENT